MRFIVDQMLPRDLAEFLISQGHEAFTARHLKLGSDESIWLYAEKIGAVVISKDADYLLLANQLSRAQFVHLQLGNLSTSGLLERFRNRFHDILEGLQAGEQIVEVK